MSVIILVQGGVDFLDLESFPDTSTDVGAFCRQLPGLYVVFAVCLCYVLSE